MSAEPVPLEFNESKMKELEEKIEELENELTKK